MIKKYKNNYLVSDEGQVWKITNKGIRLKKLTKGNSGYFTTSINGKCMFVHRIVIEAFEGVSTLHVDHLDANRTNNNLNNLEYVTPSENNKRARNRLGDKLKKRSGKKVSWNGLEFKSQKELAMFCGVTKQAVSSCLKNGYKLNCFNVNYA